VCKNHSEEIESIDWKPVDQYLIKGEWKNGKLDGRAIVILPGCFVMAANFVQNKIQVDVKTQKSELPQGSSKSKLYMTEFFFFDRGFI